MGGHQSCSRAQSSAAPHQGEAGSLSSLRAAPGRAGLLSESTLLQGGDTAPAGPCRAQSSCQNSPRRVHSWIFVSDPIRSPSSARGRGCHCTPNSSSRKRSFSFSFSSMQDSTTRCFSRLFQPRVVQHHSWSSSSSRALTAGSAGLPQLPIPVLSPQVMLSHEPSQSDLSFQCNGLAGPGQKSNLSRTRAECAIGNQRSSCPASSTSHSHCRAMRGAQQPLQSREMRDQLLIGHPSALAPYRERTSKPKGNEVGLAVSSSIHTHPELCWRAPGHPGASPHHTPQRA